MKKKLTVSVAYGTDLEKTSKLLLDIANNHPNIHIGVNFMPIIPVLEDEPKEIEILIKTLFLSFFLKLIE